MIRAAAVLVLLIYSFAIAERTAFERFETAVSAASPERMAAAAELEAAQARFQVTNEDPLAAPFEREEARAALEKARALLERVMAAARLRSFDLWANVLKAKENQELAEKQLELARVRYEAARIRAEHGAISEHDLGSAERALAEARLQLEEANTNLVSAKDEVRRYLDLEPKGVPEFTAPVKLSIKAHPDLRIALLEVGAAERSLAAAGGPDTARVERERRKAALTTARERLDQTREDLSGRLQQLQQSLDRQERLLKLKMQDAADAAAKLKAQQMRFASGLVSKIDVLQAEAALQRALQAELLAKIQIARIKLQLADFVGAK